MKINNVLITGVAGFIGSNLLDFLLEKTEWKITGIDNMSTGSQDNIRTASGNSRFKFINGDCAGLTSLKEFDCIFHLAALPRIQPSFEMISEHVQANLLVSVYLLELMIRENHFPRIVYSGSSAVYGTPGRIPTPEEEPIDCLSPYAFQKYEVEKYFELIATRYPLDYVTLRYFNPYGPRSFNPANKFNAYSSVVGIFLHLRKEKKKLQVTGNGSQRRDFIHVRDLASANYLAAIHPGKLNTAFNIGMGKTQSVLKLAQLISENYDFIAARAGEAEVTFADTTKAKELLGWSPVESLEDYIMNEIAST